MVVSWLTGVMTPTSEVRYGTVSGAYSNVANGTAASYYKDNFVHHVVLEGLQANTQYFYVCGDSEVSACGVRVLTWWCKHTCHVIIMLLPPRLGSPKSTTSRLLQIHPSVLTR